MSIVPLEMVREDGVFAYIMSKLKIKSRLLLPQVNDAVNPTLAFGDGDTGFYESVDDNINVAISGASQYLFNNSYFHAVTGRASLRNVAPTATNPNVVPNIDDTDTGIGRAAADQLSLIAGGVEGHRISEATGAITHDLTGLVNLLGGQLAFPATQAPSADVNTLDDYEEGSWTPIITFGGGVTGLTYDTQIGNYTKIGNRVFLDAFIVLSSKGTDNGDALITGLPFSCAAVSVASLRLNLITFANIPQAYSTGTTIILEEITEAGVETKLTDANFANTSSIIVQVSYRI